MFKSLLVLALACAVANGAAVHSNHLKTLIEIQADASGWVDEIFVNLRTQIVKLGLDKAPAPDMVKEFSKKILGVTWHGQAGLHDGVLTGLETVHRAGVADITTEENGDLVITVEVGVRGAEERYDAEVKFMDLGPDCSIAIKFKRLSLLLAVRVGQGMHVTLDTFKISDVGLLTGDVDGLGFTGILDFLAEILIDTAGNLFKDVAAQLIEGRIKTELDTIIKNTLYPTDPRVVSAFLATARR